MYFTLVLSYEYGSSVVNWISIIDQTNWQLNIANKSYLIKTGAVTDHFKVKNKATAAM